MMNIDEKKKLALEVIARLKQAYPDAACSLDYNEAWKLLVSVRLAAQCTDARVNMIVPKLYEKFPDVNALADAPVEEIEEIVRPCGLGKSKARDISACMRMLRDVYGGNVPNDFNALLKLPGVGRKSANLIMGDVFGKPVIVTDTHCIRLCNRIGLVDHIKEPKRWKWNCGKSFRRKKGMIYVTALCCTDVTSAVHARLRTVSTAACRISVHSAYNPHLCMLPCYDYTEGNASSGISLCISGGSGAVNSIGSPVIGWKNESFQACSA